VRLNVTLDAEHAQKLARPLLSTALDEVDPSPEDIVALLDGMPGARERARLGSEHGRRGETLALDDLA
jgi:hypothetical protein